MVEQDSKKFDSPSHSKKSPSHSRKFDSPSHSKKFESPSHSKTKRERKVMDDLVALLDLERMIHGMIL